MSEYYKESTNVKVYQEGECDEYDTKPQIAPFKGLLSVIFQVTVKA